MFFNVYTCVGIIHPPSCHCNQILMSFKPLKLLWSTIMEEEFRPLNKVAVVHCSWEPYFIKCIEMLLGKCKLGYLKRSKGKNIQMHPMSVECRIRAIISVIAKEYFLQKFGCGCDWRNYILAGWALPVLSTFSQQGATRPPHGSTTRTIT